MHKKIGTNIIHCIGDSHVSIFNGTDNISMGGELPYSKDTHPNFKSYNLGPALAYNLNKKGHKWNNLLNNVLKNIPKKDYILLSFGQIDCCNHLPKQKILQPERSYIVIIKECVNKYFSVIKNIKEEGFNVIVYGPVIPQYCEYAQYNREDKKFALKLFTEYLSLLCKDNNILHISMYDKLTDKNDMLIKHYYRETMHLNTNAFELVINELKINQILNS